MSDNEQYKQMLTEIIAKQSDILGPDIAILKARNVEGLSVNDEGEVTHIEGDAKALLQKLLDEYVSLSGQIVKSALSSVFEKYPSMQHDNE